MVYLPEVEDALEHRAIPMGEPAPLHFAEGKLRVPPPTAVAHQLLRAIVGGYMKE
jgi:NAD+ diphosphatase